MSRIKLDEGFITQVLLGDFGSFLKYLRKNKENEEKILDTFGKLIPFVVSQTADEVETFDENTCLGYGVLLGLSLVLEEVENKAEILKLIQKDKNKFHYVFRWLQAFAEYIGDTLINGKIKDFGIIQ